MSVGNIHSLLCLLPVLVALCTACSTTKRLPSGECLYTGIRKIEVTKEDRSDAGDEALSEIEAALAFPPNNALFGSSQVRIPLPFGLWMYNSLAGKENGLSRWMFRLLATQPVLLSDVNPELRVKIAQNLLHEHGYFDGHVACDTLFGKRDPRQAKLRYRIVMHMPYLCDSIEYRRMQSRADTLLKLSESDRLLRRGDPFNVIRLDEERHRIATLMRNNGYFYFRPDYIACTADSTLAPRRISLRIGLAQGLPAGALRRWKIGRITFRLHGYNNEPPTDSLWHENMILYYSNPLHIRPRILYRQFKFHSGELYSQARQTQTQEALNHLAVFRYADMQYAPNSESRTCDTLNLTINATYDLPLSGETEINFTANSNKRVGPGAVFSFAKNNLFGGGESLGLSLNGAYEWLAGRGNGTANALTDNYEYGSTGSFTFPRVLLPRFFRREYNFPSSSQYQLYANRLNRAEYFRILSFGGSATYDFSPNPIRHHTFIPFRLSFNHLEYTTPRFDSIAAVNSALFQSLRRQFIPAIGYTYTLDNAPVRKGRHMTWWQFSVIESGNLLSAAYALTGRGFDEPKRILGNPFSQFLKATSELRYNYAINRNQRLVGRIGGGLIYSYGNATAAPYSEQFYVGGANSIRAFTLRSIGPGRTQPDRNDRLSNLDHTGDFKLEGNLEYRFDLVGDLEGALFLDAGNVWLLRTDSAANNTDGQLSWRHFLRDIAVGTGVGLRYNFGALVVRLDAGIALHVPYVTGRNRYFNKPSDDGFNFHIAVGYPF